MVRVKECRDQILRVSTFAVWLGLLGYLRLQLRRPRVRGSRSPRKTRTYYRYYAIHGANDKQYSLFDRLVTPLYLHVGRNVLLG